MRLEPFKVRRGRIKEAMDAAVETFGQPVETSATDKTHGMRWHFYDEMLLEYGLEIGFFSEGLISMTIQVRNTATDQTLFGPVIAGKSTHRLIEDFVGLARKPWAEWGEEEIMADPMWVHMYKRDGNEPTRAMENMMAMLSFQSPNNIWVRKYFGGEK